MLWGPSSQLKLKQGKQSKKRDSNNWIGLNTLQSRGDLTTNGGGGEESPARTAQYFRTIPGAATLFRVGIGEQNGGGGGGRL